MARQKKPEPWQVRLGVYGLNPIQVMELQAAVRIRAATVELEGEAFSLRYYEEEGMVFYKCVGAFVPCGYIRISKLLEEI